MTYDYVIGMDVGKYFHHACVLDIDGTQVLSKRINQKEKFLRKFFSYRPTCFRHAYKLVSNQAPSSQGGTPRFSPHPYRHLQQEHFCFEIQDSAPGIHSSSGGLLFKER